MPATDSPLKNKAVCLPNDVLMLFCIKRVCIDICIVILCGVLSFWLFSSVTLAMTLHSLVSFLLFTIFLKLSFEPCIYFGVLKSVDRKYLSKKRYYFYIGVLSLIPTYSCFAILHAITPYPFTMFNFFMNVNPIALISSYIISDYVVLDAWFHKIIEWSEN